MIRAAIEERNFTVTFNDTGCKINKDGTECKISNHKELGVSSEVYAFKTEEEIAAVIRVFDQRIQNASDDDKKQIARRNKLLFVIGINLGIRASDLRSLKWNFFFEEIDGEIKFRDYYSIQPKKTKNKYVKLFFNQTVKKAIESYTSYYPVQDLDSFLFPSRKGDEPILERSMCRIIKDAASDAGIKQNIGSHSLRKTFGFWCWHNASNPDKALVLLQQIFNHSSTQITLRYIGVLHEEMEDMFDSIELGYAMV